MLSIYDKLTTISKEQKKAALCIVVSTKGSAPRETGAKMIVYEDGSIYETIGGGELEDKLEEESE